MKAISLLALLAALCLALPVCAQKKKAKKEKNEAPAVVQPAAASLTQVLAAVVPEAPVLRLTDDRFAFGKVEQGQLIKHTFQFVNEGGKDLLITQVTPSCGCTATSWTREAIRPGATGEIAISFNTAGKMGPQNKTITVVSNTEPAIRLLYLTGEVVSPGIPLNAAVVPPPIKKN
jgi:Protein of unknown function (DUF1573)